MAEYDGATDEFRGQAKVFTDGQWWTLPLTLRRRWWAETAYMSKPASPELLKDIAGFLAANGP